MGFNAFTRHGKVGKVVFKKIGSLDFLSRIWGKVIDRLQGDQPSKKIEGFFSDITCVHRSHDSPFQV
jgi:hypothetical protein